MARVTDYASLMPCSICDNLVASVDYNFFRGMCKACQEGKK